jgi:hypothetical protein
MFPESYDMMAMSIGTGAEDRCHELHVRINPLEHLLRNDLTLWHGGNLISPTVLPRSPEQAATLSRNVTKQSTSAGMSPTFLPRSRAEATATSALAGEVVNDSQDPKATTIRESVADEVEAPALIGTRRQCQRPSRSQGTLATATFAHGQLLFPIETPELLQVHDDPPPIQHDVNAPIAETTAL